MPKKDNLNSVSIRGGKLTLATQVLTILVQLATVTIISRFVTPSEYGIVAMVMAVINFASLFRELGLSSAAIQKNDLTAAQQSNLFWINTGSGLLVTLVVGAIAPVVAWFYGKEELTNVTLIAALSFVVGGVGIQSRAQLLKGLLFGRKAITDAAALLIGFVVSVTLAINGWSYWSLIWGNLANVLVGTVLVYLMSPFRPIAFQFRSGTRSLLAFGANVAIFDFINYLSRNLDNILIGKEAGDEALGFYNRAYTVAMLPIKTVLQPIRSVAFPVMSRLKDDRKSYVQYCNDLTSLIAALSIPIGVYLCVQSDRVIGLLLGEQWDDSASLLAILSFAMLLQPVCAVRGLVMLTTNKSKRYAFCGVLNAVVVSVGFGIGVFWGETGVAVSYAIANTVLFFPMTCYILRDDHYPAREFFRQIMPFVVVSAAAGITVSGVSRLVEIESDFWALLMSGIVFLFVFITLLAVFCRETLMKGRLLINKF